MRKTWRKLAAQWKKPAPVGLLRSVQKIEVVRLTKSPSVAVMTLHCDGGPVQILMTPSRAHDLIAQSREFLLQVELDP